MKLVQKRLFLGNLPSKLSKSDVVQKLQEYGNVQSVELKQRKDDEGNLLSSFAFANVETDTEKLYSCFRRFQSELWDGHKIKVEVARESFLDRLKREQKEANQSKSNIKSNGFNDNSFEQSHSLNRTDGGNKRTISNSNIEENNKPATKDYNFLHVAPEQATTKSSVKTDKIRKDRSQKTRIADDDSKKPNLEKSDIENDPVTCDEKETWGSLPMFSGTKNLKDLDDDRNSNVGLRRKDCSQILVAKLKDKKERKSHGKLPMFSGTKDWNDVNDGFLVDNLSSSRRKRNSYALSSPEKRRNECNSSSSERKSRGATSDNTSNADQAIENNFYQENVNNSREKKKIKPEIGRNAEEKRVNALEERNKAIHMQKEAVKKALSSVDVRTNANKIIFDDDEDTEDEGKFSTQSKSMDQQIAGAPKPRLFDDSSDDEDLKDLRKEEFKIKPQFEGPKGQKLLAIQSQYGNDTRFNLDERFLESDEEMQPQEEGDEQDFKAEKQHQLNILQEILGVNVSTKPVKKVTPENRNQLQMVRFDPSNPEHSKYLLKEEIKESKKKTDVEKEDKKTKKKRKEVEENAEEKPLPTSTERFYEVSDMLKESLKKRTESSGTATDNEAEGAKGFSLLKAFGSAPSDSEEEEKVESYATRPIKGGLHEWDKNPFRYDSSDEEEEETNTFQNRKEISSAKISDSTKKGKLSKGVFERFHFKDNDPRLEEGLAFFRVEKTFEEMQEGFHEKRTDLKSIIKAKLRNNKRKQLPFRKKLGGVRKKFPKGRR